MAKLIRNIRTTAGKKLINSAISGENKLIYTTAELFTKDISSLTDDQLAETSDLGSSLLSGKISITDYNDTSVTASAEFLNSSLTNDIAFKTIGWYATTAIDKAQGKPPVLFVISQLDKEATMVSGNNERTTSFFIPRIIMRISNAETVVLETGEVGFVTLPELEGKIADLANKGLIDFGQKFNKGFNLKSLHNTSLHYVDKGSVIGLPEASENEPKDLGGYLISLGKGDTTQDGVQIYFNPFSNKTFISYYLNKTNTWTDWLEVGSKSYTKEEIKTILNDYATKASMTQLLAGKANTSDLAKFVQSVEGFKPDKETGNVVFLSGTYENQAIEPNTFIKPGVYKIVNCTYKFVSISSIGANDALNGYLIVTKGKTDNDVFQYLITDINDNTKINFRKVNPPRYIYPEFKKLLDNKDVHRFSDPDNYYTSKDTVDVDLLTEAGIYHFMDAHVTSSMRKDALDGLPRTGDGTEMCGYLIVLKHDNFNREQILILNSGVEIPDFAIAVRSVSGTNAYRPRFRKVLKIEDASLDVREHTYSRNAIFDTAVDENQNAPLIPSGITSISSDSNRISLNNLINTYTKGARVLADFITDEIPQTYSTDWQLHLADKPAGTISNHDTLFNKYTQRVEYCVEPVLYGDKYDTHQTIKSGGFIFERYHNKNYDVGDIKKGWTNWVFTKGYMTGLGERPFNSWLTSTVNTSAKTSSFSTIGVDNAPQIPPYADLNMFYGVFEPQQTYAYYPSGTYVRRAGDSHSASINFPVGTPTALDMILRVTAMPQIGDGRGSSAYRMIAHVIQEAFMTNVPGVYGVTTYYIRQGYVYIPKNDTTSIQVEYRPWGRIVDF